MATQVDIDRARDPPGRGCTDPPGDGHRGPGILAVAQIPYAVVDPFILVHEAVVSITPERANLNTKHPHRGFDNL
jgi:hypothetical protein